MSSVSSCSSCSADAAIAAVQKAKEGSVQAQVSVAVAAKGLDAIRQQGATIVKMLESAASVGRSANTGRVFDAMG